jgi:putative endonuclease
MPFVYMLRCADGTLYVGSTLDLDRRIAQHAAGEGAVYTRRRLPVELVWSEEMARISDAFAWEKRLQGWSHAKRSRMPRVASRPCAGGARATAGVRAFRLGAARLAQRPG